MTWSNNIGELATELSVIGNSLNTLALDLADKKNNSLELSKEAIADILFASVNHMQRIGADLERLNQE